MDEFDRYLTTITREAPARPGRFIAVVGGLTGAMAAGVTFALYLIGTALRPVVL